MKNSSQDRTGSRRKSSSLIKKLLVSFGMLVLLYVVGELSLRIHYRRHDTNILNGVRILWSHAFAHQGVPGTRGWRVSPEYKVFEEINTDGYRDSGNLTASNSVFFLGDSFVWGLGVSETEKMGNVFSSLSKAPVVNYGAFSAGTIHELAIYAAYIHPKKPRRVFLIWYPNDIQNNLTWVPALGSQGCTNELAIIKNINFRASLPVFWPQGDNLKQSKIGFSAVAFWLRERFDAVRAKHNRPTLVINGVTVDRSAFLGDHYLTAAITLPVPNIDDAWTLTKTCLRMLDNYCRHDGATLVVVYLPYMDAIHPEAGKNNIAMSGCTLPPEILDVNMPKRRLLDLCSQLQIPCIDTTQDLLDAASANPSSPLYFPIDAHLTARGHKVVAESIFKAVPNP